MAGCSSKLAQALMMADYSHAGAREGPPANGKATASARAANHETARPTSRNFGTSAFPAQADDFVPIRSRCLCCTGLGRFIAANHRQRFCLLRHRCSFGNVNFLLAIRVIRGSRDPNSRRAGTSNGDRDSSRFGDGGSRPSYGDAGLVQLRLICPHRRDPPPGHQGRRRRRGRRRDRGVDCRGLEFTRAFDGCPRS